MSFLSALSGILGIGAVPITGGASLAIPALIGAGADIGGGILQGISQGRQQDKQNALTQQSLALQQAQAAPQRQNWRQNQALMAALIPGLANASVSAPAGYQQYMPKINGGFRLPEQGLGTPDVMNFFSESARVNAERELDNAGKYDAKGKLVKGATPPSMNYGQAGYGIGAVRPPVSPTEQNAALGRALGPRR
jgi:hypothetical protein